MTEEKNAQMQPDTEAFWLYDRFTGARAGSYEFTFEHQLHEKNKENEGRKETVTLTLDVQAPRLALPSPGDVRAMYPPAAGTSDYSQVLPHVVLASRSLPWECAIGQGPNLDGTPWVALLLLSADDMADASLRHVSGKDLAEGDKATLESPWLHEDAAFKVDDAEAKQSIAILELSSTRFRALCPNVQDLPLLAHIRRVSLAEKADGGAASMRDFAVVLANRVPQAGINTAVLVSLEGWVPWLQKTDASSDVARVRLVVLHSWGFTSLAGNGTFFDQVKEITVGPLALDPTNLQIQEPSAKKALSEGRVPVAYQGDAFEVPKKTFSWYRGPLSPVSVQAVSEKTLSFSRADEAILIDPTTGMTDISYSSAWQLGQLLALSSASFGEALLRWNDRRLRETSETQERRPFVLQEMSDWLGSHNDPPDPKNRQKRDERYEDISAVVQWLSLLPLLALVPLRYLVPSGKLLPSEKMRFFQVDPNWIDALMEGALLVAESERFYKLINNQDKQPLLRRELQDVLEKLQTMLGLPQRRSLFGFLLRTRVFTSFPGVEVEVLEKDGARVLVLRRDMVAPDTMLVLVEKTPERVVVKEPREGLRFRASGKDQAFVTSKGDVPGVIDLGKVNPKNLRSAGFASEHLSKPQDVQFDL